MQSTEGKIKGVFVGVGLLNCNCEEKILVSGQAECFITSHSSVKYCQLQFVALYRSQGLLTQEINTSFLYLFCLAPE